jgi:hypothetical protein
LAGSTISAIRILDGVAANCDVRQTGLQINAVALTSIDACVNDDVVLD